MRCLLPSSYDAAVGPRSTSGTFCSRCIDGTNGLAAHCSFYIADPSVTTDVRRPSIPKVGHVRGTWCKDTNSKSWVCCLVKQNGCGVVYNMIMWRQAERQAGSQTGRQADRQKDRQTGRQTGRQGDRQADSAHGHTNLGSRGYENPYRSEMYEHNVAHARLQPRGKDLLRYLCGLSAC